jgi:hypothetical protein
MFADMKGIYEGEIVGVNETLDDNDMVVYQVRITQASGHDMYLPAVEDRCMFGGLADYSLFKRRTTDSGKTLSFDTDAKTRYSTIGDRVLIAFVAGSIHKPIIIANLRHPNRTFEFDGEDLAKLDPQGIIQYLGLRMVVDKDGQFTFIHTGKPEVKDLNAAGPLGAVAGAVAAAFGEKPSNPLLSSAANDAVTSASTENITLMEFLKEGVFRIRDSEGQMIEMDRTKSRIYISNNDLKSTEDAAGGPASGGNLLSSNSTDAEYILLDKDKELVLINARQIIQLYSFDRRKDVTEGDHQHKVKGDNKWLISGDDTQTVGGDKETSVSGNLLYDVTGETTINSSASIALLATGEFTINGSTVTIEDTGKAFVKMNGGTIQIGTAAGELLDTLAKVIEQVATIAQAISTMTVGTGTGPSTPPVNAADFIKANVDLQLLKTLVETMKG